MTARSYMSIGDVLSLLRREFPDVTISKIRFLESQGLVDPERTPSGYRKFYDHDVERLRWVLRQQREHFLPLKVIKGRLEQQDHSPTGNGSDTQGAPAMVRVGDRPAIGDDDPDSEQVADADQPGVVDEPLRRLGQSGPQLVSQNAANQLPGLAEPHPVEHEIDEGPGRFGNDRPASGAAGPGRAGLQATVRSVGARAADHPADSEASQTVPLVGRRQRPEEPSPSDRFGSSRDEVTAERVAQTAGGPDTDSGSLGSVTSRGRAAHPASVGPFSGVSMTASELAQASGLSPEQIGQLESFGLLSGRTVGGVVYYDEESLIVANLAASFAKFGVEARHLRLHLLAAQREAGFIEQIVLPLIKQRNPTSRQRASETVTELSQLGQDLRSVLLRRGLRELLGG